MVEAVARRVGTSKGNRCSHHCAQVNLWVLALLVFGVPSVAEAYVGPGAGIAFVGSFLVILTTIVLSFLSMLAWPFRMLIRAIKYRNVPRPLIKRFIIVGLDGQDPKLTDRFMKEGKLPNFSALAKEGCYHPLRTTFPSISPVAWSSFSTGSHPARHNIYDFLDRDRRTYLPVLSSVKIGPVARRLKIGKYRIPLGKPEVRLLRKSKSFWQILGEHNIWSTVLRVPITFPADRFKGAQLSAMCVPDLLGTQGTFIFFTTRESSEVIKEGGIRVHLPPDGPNSDHFVTEIPGPDNDLIDGSPPMKIPVVIDIDRVNNCVDVSVDDERYTLEPGKLTDWVEIGFKAAPGITIRGICRMLVTEMKEHFGLYISPISFDPEKPVMPVSHPSYYSTYLAKKVGKFSTLGLAEDTWALNEGIIDDGAFLQMTYDIDKEREKNVFRGAGAAAQRCPSVRV